jgi:hypothetical protein
MEGRLQHVYVVGIMNPKGEPDGGFDLTDRELALIADTPPNQTPLLIEHNYDTTSPEGLRQVGIIVKFWLSATGSLWGLAEINPKLQYGPRAIRRLMTGEFRGFSLGIPFDSEHFKNRNEVIKFGLAEVSLVEAPDIPSTVLMATSGAETLLEWPRIQTLICGMYCAADQKCDETVLDFFIQHRELWPLVTAARARDRMINGQFK